jgi:hypothetical protein
VPDEDLEPVGFVPDNNSEPDFEVITDVLETIIELAEAEEEEDKVYYCETTDRKRLPGLASEFSVVEDITAINKGLPGLALVVFTVVIVENLDIKSKQAVIIEYKSIIIEIDTVVAPVGVKTKYDISQVHIVCTEQKELLVEIRFRVLF